MYKGDVVVEWKYTDALTRIRDLEEEISILKEYIDRVQKTVNNG